MAAGHHPENAVVVERQIPLHVTRPILQDVFVVALQRRGVGRIEVAVPAAMISRFVVPYRVAHEHHFGDSGVFHAQQAAADALHVLVQPTLDRADSLRIDLAGQRLQIEAGLGTGLPGAAGRVLRSPLARPDHFLPLDEQFIGPPQVGQLMRRNDLPQDHISLFQKLIAVDFHGCFLFLHCAISRCSTSVLFALNSCIPCARLTDNPAVGEHLTASLREFVKLLLRHIDERPLAEPGQ